MQQKVARLCPLHRLVWIVETKQYSCSFTRTWNEIMNMNNDRLLKKVLFSDAFEGKRKPGRPLLSWRQAIAQDIKNFNLQHLKMISGIHFGRMGTIVDGDNINWKSYSGRMLRQQKGTRVLWDSKRFSFEIRVVLEKKNSICLYVFLSTFIISS
jgi:hypothetical protein